VNNNLCGKGIPAEDIVLKGAVPAPARANQLLMAVNAGSPKKRVWSVAGTEKRVARRMNK